MADKVDLRTALHFVFAENAAAYLMNRAEEAYQLDAENGTDSADDNIDSLIVLSYAEAINRIVLNTEKGVRMKYFVTMEDISNAAMSLLQAAIQKAMSEGRDPFASFDLS